MGKVNNRVSSGLKSFIASWGSQIISEALKDRETLEEWLVEYLNEALSDTSPFEFKRAFEENRDLSEFLDDKKIEGVQNFINENNIDMRQIRNSVRYHLPSFDERWAMRWLQKDLPEFHEMIILHPRRKEFQKWFSNQISNVGDKIINAFRVY